MEIAVQERSKHPPDSKPLFESPSGNKMMKENQMKVSCRVF
jgi:hypothetical protein